MLCYADKARRKHPVALERHGRRDAAEDERLGLGVEAHQRAAGIALDYNLIVIDLILLYLLDAYEATVGGDVGGAKRVPCVRYPEPEPPAGVGGGDREHRRLNAFN